MTTPAARSPNGDGNIEADRLLAEARKLHAEAKRDRRRVRRLASRFASRFKQKLNAERQRIADDRAALENERQRLAAETERFQTVLLEYRTGSVAAHQRFRESWAELQKEQQRAAHERAESEAYFRQQEKVLAARQKDLQRQTQRAADEKARLDASIAARRKELEGLDTRITHVHATLREAEEKHAALLRAAIPEADPVDALPEPAVSLDRRTDRDLLQLAAELDRREHHLRREQVALLKRNETVEKAAGQVMDQRRILTERSAMLALAQERWNEVERHTLGEIEDLAHVLRRREREIDERERGLIAADRRRREESYALWQVRLQLDGWRGVLTAHEAWWQTERGRQEVELAEHRATLLRHDRAVSSLTARWNEKCKAERDRLRAEADRWALGNKRLEQAITAYDRQRNESLATQRNYAAKSLALDETFREALGGDDSSRSARRFKVLRKRWEQTFEFRRREIDRRLEAVNEEKRKLERRHRDLHKLLAEVADRTGEGFQQAAEREQARLPELPGPFQFSPPAANTDELTALRSEVERLAFALINAEWPTPAAENDEPPLAVPVLRREAA